MKYFETTFFMKKLIESRLEKKLCDNINYFLTLNAKFEYHKKDDILFRIGDKGEKFYIIVQGSVSVLKPKQVVKSITIREYLNTLNNLKRANETYLYEKIVNANIETFLIKERLFDKLIEILANVLSGERRISRKNSLAKNNIFSSKSTLSQNNIEDDELDFLDRNNNDFKDLSEYYYIIKENTKYNFFLEEYEKIIELKSGFSFGDYALESTNRLRTATIRIESDCYFAVIKQEDYSNYLLSEKKSSKMKEFKFLYEGFFYKNFDREKFDKFYFSEFIYEEYPIGCILDVESSKTDNIEDKKMNLNSKKNNICISSNINNYNYVSSLYLIKEGQVEISLNKNLVELFNLIRVLVNCNQSLNSLIDLTAYGNYLEKKLKTHSKELLKKRNLSIMKIGVNDFLGVEEFYFKLPFLFQAKVVSEKLCVYKLTQEGLNKIMDREGISRKFMQEHVLIKISNKITRMVNLNKTFLRIIDNEVEELKINLEKKLKRDKTKSTVIEGESSIISKMTKNENDSKSRNINASLYDKTSSIQKNINNLITNSPGRFGILNSYDIGDNFNLNCLNNMETINTNNSKYGEIKFSKLKKNDLLKGFRSTNDVGAGVKAKNIGVNLNGLIGKMRMEAGENYKIIETNESNILINTNIGAYKNHTRKINKVLNERDNSPTLTNSTKKSFSQRNSNKSKSLIGSPEFNDTKINKKVEFLDPQGLKNYQGVESSCNNADAIAEKTIINTQNLDNISDNQQTSSCLSLNNVKLGGVRKYDTSKLLPSLGKINHIINENSNEDEKEKEMDKHLKTQIRCARKKSFMIETPHFNKFQKLEQILNVPEKASLLPDPSKWKRGSIDFSIFKNKLTGKSDSSTNLKLGLQNIFKKFSETDQNNPQQRNQINNSNLKDKTEEKSVLNKNENKKEKENKDANESVSFSEMSAVTVNEDNKIDKAKISKNAFNQAELGIADDFGINSPQKFFNFNKKNNLIFEENDFTDNKERKETPDMPNVITSKTRNMILKKSNSGKESNSNANPNINKSYDFNFNNTNIPNSKRNDINNDNSNLYFNKKTRNIKSDFFINKIINQKNTNSLKFSVDKALTFNNPSNNYNHNNLKSYDNLSNLELIEVTNESKNSENNKTGEYIKTNNPSNYNVNFNLYLNLNLNTGNLDSINKTQTDKQSIINNYYYKGSKSIPKKISLDNDSRRMKNVNKLIPRALNLQTDNLEKIINEFKNKSIGKNSENPQDNSNMPSNRILNSNLNSDRSSYNPLSMSPHLQKSIENLAHMKYFIKDHLASVSNNKVNDIYSYNNANNNNEIYLENKTKSNSEHKNYLFNNDNNVNYDNGFFSSRNRYYNYNINDNRNANENYSARNYVYDQSNLNHFHRSDSNITAKNYQSDFNPVNDFELKKFDFGNVMSSLPMINSFNYQSENSGQKNAFILRNNASISLKKYFNKDKRVRNKQN